jgi:uncharacterized protein (DUF736 family)
MLPLSIGAFERNTKGQFEGILQGLGIGSIPVLFEKNTNKTGNQPDYYLFAHPHDENYYRIGSAWEPKPNKQHHYVRIESPWLPTPLVEASLSPDKNITGQFNLFWYAASDKTPKADATAQAEQAELSSATATQAQPTQKRSLFAKTMSPQA